MSPEPPMHQPFRVPPVPGPVAVTLDPAATAVLAFDMSDLLCAPVAPCAASVPLVRAFLDRARAARAAVAFSCGRQPQQVLAALGPRPDEPVVRTSADKFFETELGRYVAGRVVVMMGTNANGSVLYSAMGACARGLTVVVADDGISSRHPFGTALARWQLLHQPGFPNADNAPLRANAVTLSRTDLITFRGARR
jgi:nicotinamidase-related amidase